MQSVEEHVPTYCGERVAFICAKPKHRKLVVKPQQRLADLTNTETPVK